jgi:RNA-directed DNA polymerase
MIDESKISDSASIHMLTWAAVFNKYQPHKHVRRLQLRIVKAVKQNCWGQVKYLSRILTSSFYAKLLAIKRVTSNKGKNTPGVDKKTWLTDNEKIQAIFRLNRKGYKPLPLRRIHIPKKDRTKLRPLSIPTIKDRAMQALHFLALEPIAETLGDPNSYGFRKFRSCADAIQKCFNVLCHKYDAQWVYEADIKSCFDKISHHWLLANIPMDKAILRKWLKCGYVENYRKFNTNEGTPQGGIISPMLMNMTLDGLELFFRQKFPTWKRSKVNFVRYADDFVITAPSKELIENQIAPLVESFLKERGLQISPEKTRITHINDGFDFLSQNVQKYGNKLLIKPSKGSVTSFKEKIKLAVQQCKGHAAHTLICKLNPIIRGWVNYHKHIVSKRTFWELSKYIFAKLLKWAKQQHPNKKIHWIWDKYFSSGNRNGRFSEQVNGKDGKMRSFQLFEIGFVPIRRFVKVLSGANPFDENFDKYFAQRHKEKRKAAEISHQKCIYLLNTINKDKRTSK